MVMLRYDDVILPGTSEVVQALESGSWRGDSAADADRKKVFMLTGGLV